jgi:hypothetical protein
MKILKSIKDFIFDKYAWTSALIELPFWTVFFFGGVYIAFVARISPTIKTILLIILSLSLYLFCGVIKRIVFKKNKTP